MFTNPENYPTDLNGAPFTSFALSHANNSVLNSLLCNGASTATKDTNGRTLLAQAINLLDTACFTGNQAESKLANRLKSIHILRDYGADPLEDGSGVPCCFLGFRWWHEETIKGWLLNAVSSDHRNLRGETLIMIAAQRASRPELLALLRTLGGIDLKDNEGRTALTHAAASEYATVEEPWALELLVAYGANIEHQDNHGLTPLMTAAMKGNLRNVRWLLERGASKDSRDSKNNTARDLAIKHTTLIELINLLR